MESQVTFSVKVKKDNPETCIFQFDDEQLIDSIEKFGVFINKVMTTVTKDWFQKSNNNSIDVFFSLGGILWPIITDKLYYYYLSEEIVTGKEFLFVIKFNVVDDYCDLISSNVTERSII